MPASFWPEFALLCGAGLIGLICLAPYMMELVSAIIKRDAKPPPVPKWMLIALTSAQSLVLVAVATGLGLLIGHHIGLGAPLLVGLLSGKSVRAQALAMIAPALILGILSASLLLVLEITVFWPRLPKAMQKEFPIPAFWKRFLVSFYGGIDEELLLRLFLLSLLAWLIGLVWQAPGGMPSLGAFWLANITSAVVFGLGHLPITAALVRLTPLLILRAVLLNGIVGIAAGYLFWSYGLEAAMLAHFAADIVIQRVGSSVALRIYRT